MAKNIPEIEYMSGTIKVGWSISEKDLKIDQIQRDLTREEKLSLYDRIEESVTSSFSQVVDLLMDGEDQPPVRVHLEVTSGFTDLEIDDGPMNGMIDDLREEEG